MTCVKIQSLLSLTQNNLPLIVLRYVKELKDVRGIKFKMEEIGITSPYHKQVRKIVWSF